jgi:hypothetical protein
MKDVRKHLEKKGWSKREIQKVIKIFENAKAHQHPKIRILEKSLYWILLSLAIIKNLIISISLIPVLLFFKGIVLYFIIILLGLSFGIFFNLLIKRIEDLEVKHHLFLGILIPLSSIFSFILVLSFASGISGAFGIEVSNKPLLVGSVYSIAFLLPYLIYNLVLKEKI